MGASGGVSGVWGWYAHPAWGRGRCWDGPRCAVLPQQGYTPVSRHSTHVTAKRICHITIHMSQYSCDHSIHMSQHTTHVTKQAVHATQDTDIDYLIWRKRPCIARMQHNCCLTALLHSTCLPMADMQVCVSQKSMQAILLMIINCCNKGMTHAAEASCCCIAVE